MGKPGRLPRPTRTACGARPTPTISNGTSQMNFARTQTLERITKEAQCWLRLNTVLSYTWRNRLWVGACLGNALKTPRIKQETLRHALLLILDCCQYFLWGSKGMGLGRV